MTLNGGGNPNAVFIFKMASTLNTVDGGSVVLTGGAQACNVFWQVGTSATLGTDTTFEGTIMADQSITDAGDSVINGRLLAKSAAVTLSNTTVTVPTCAPSLHLRKTVVTDNGGTAHDTDWTLTASGSMGAFTLLSGTSPVDSDIVYPNATFASSTHALTEAGGPAGYASSTWACTGGGVQSGSDITVRRGDNVTCTITNDDIPPKLHLRNVINGGTATAGDFTLTADGAGANDFQGTTPVDSVAGLVADTFALSETSPSGYTASDWVCSGDGTLSGSNITLGIGEETTCTITNNYTAVAPVVVTPSSSGGSGYDVSSSVPLIHVTKVSSPRQLPARGGLVTYTEVVTNPGISALSNVRITDDKCAPVKYIFGDINRDSKLDPTETRTYTCHAKITKTTTNTATAEGVANYVTVRDSATATVTVVPKLPSTGFSPMPTFSRSLSLGMKGDDVSSLQTVLAQKNLLAIPAGVTKGYFGALTKTAVKKYQASVKLPVIGTFGPLTRAKLVSDLGE